MAGVGVKGIRTEVLLFGKNGAQVPNKRWSACLRELMVEALALFVFRCYRELITILDDLETQHYRWEQTNLRMKADPMGLAL